jgi:hypothetical protein
MGFYKQQLVQRNRYFSENLYLVQILLVCQVYISPKRA